MKKRFKKLVKQFEEWNEEFESLEEIARGVAATINHSREEGSNNSNQQLLLGYVNAWFADFTDINASWRLVMFKSMEFQFDPLVAYVPLIEVMQSFQDIFKKYNFLLLDETDIAKIICRKYIMDYAWSYANPHEDEDTYDGCSPQMRDDYGDMEKYFGGYDEIAIYLFYDIEAKYYQFLQDKLKTGMSSKDIYKMTQKSYSELDYEDKMFCLKPVTEEYLDELIKQIQVH